MRGILLAVAIGFVGCCPKVEVRPDPLPLPLPTVPGAGGCLVDPPPSPEPLVIELGGEGACPAGMGACLSPEQAGALAASLVRERRWAREAWLLCSQKAPRAATAP